MWGIDSIINPPSKKKSPLLCNIIHYRLHLSLRFLNSLNLCCFVFRSKLAMILRTNNTTSSWNAGRLIQLTDNRQLHRNGKVRLDALYYIVRGERGALATSGGLQPVVSVGRSLVSRLSRRVGLERGKSKWARDHVLYRLHSKSSDNSSVAWCPNIRFVVYVRLW
jgi:hypothetical protein